MKKSSKPASSQKKQNKTEIEVTKTEEKVETGKKESGVTDLKKYQERTNQLREKYRKMKRNDIIFVILAILAFITVLLIGYFQTEMIRTRLNTAR